MSETMSGQCARDSRQILVIALCIFLNGLDGFDVLSIGFAAPSLSHEWHISRAALGTVLSAELLGMSLGAIGLGYLADRIGRKAVVLACLLAMGLGMLAASLAQNITSLAIIRFATGIGIGGMLASISAIAAAAAPKHRQALAVALMAAGYPLGGALGGTVAAWLLSKGDWRNIFVFGAICSFAMLPLVTLILGDRPVSKPSEAHRLQTDGASFPFARTSLFLVPAYFFHMMTLYFFLKWATTFATSVGVSPSDAGYMLVLANIGGALGSFAFSLALARISARKAMSFILIASFASISLFALPAVTQGSWAMMLVLAVLAGLTSNAGVVGLYAIVATSYPSQMRARGTGLVIGLGRGGAAMGPFIAGALLNAQIGASLVAIAMASGSLFSAIALIALRRQQPAS